MARQIYIAEDSPTQALFVKSILRHDPSLEVSVFEDGLELYRAVQKNPPQLVILDIILPTLTGLAVCRLLKFHERYQSLPILMVSSITDEDIRERARLVGADAFLPKPLKKKELQEAVESLIGAGA